MAHTESFLPVLRLVDQSHHRWVGRGVDASLFVFFRHEIHRRRVRQMLLERIERLIHQRNTIREKENALCPIASHQQIAQGDYRSCFASAGSHYQERFSRVVAFESFAYPTNRAGLLVTLDDRLADLCFGQLLTRCLSLDEQLQLALLVESLHRAGRMW